MASEKQKEYNRQYYLKNREKILKHNSKYNRESPKRKIWAKEYTKKAYRRRALWLKELKSKLFCIKCGENRTPCLEFHHRDPKEKDYDVGQMIKKTSKARILEEIAKCDVLCSNCHKMEHYKEDSLEAKLG